MKSQFLSGSLIDSISQEEFLHAYFKNLPNKWTKFAFKYFSKSTSSKDKWLSKLIQGILIALFVIGFAGTMLGVSHLFHWIVIIPFAIILVALAILMFSALIMNNLRIRKVCKILGISRIEYELLAKYYL